MKASLKTILLAFFATIVCIVGGYGIKNKRIKEEEVKKNPVKIIELGQALQLEEEDLLAFTPKEEIVFEDMTLDELSKKLDRSLKNELSKKGSLIASYSLEKGVDPYVATAIILQETGCKWNCSRLVKSCNNVGGQKGSGCGSYRYYSSLEDGIKSFIDGLSKNYFSKGLTTPKQINKRYATSKTWYQKIEAYIDEIRRK